MIFLVSISTYVLSFIGIQNRKIQFEKSLPKIICLLVTIIICFSVLLTKYVFFKNPQIGKTVTRQQMIGNPEFYEYGRNPVLPIKPISREISQNIARGSFFLSILAENISVFLSMFIFLVALGFLIYETIIGKLKIPTEILMLFLASIILFYIADYFLLKLFRPARYLEYSMPLISLIIISVAAAQLLLKIVSFR